MRKLSQTEELVKILAGRARRHTLTPEQISRAMPGAPPWRARRPKCPMMI